jgi:hypothetical protein
MVEVLTEGFKEGMKQIQNGGQGANKGTETEKPKTFLYLNNLKYLFFFFAKQVGETNMKQVEQIRNCKKIIKQIDQRTERNPGLRGHS